MEEDNWKDPNPWHPIVDPVDVKHLGKLLEELGEAGAAASRCLIQGIDEAEPETGRINRTWLEQELADVQANIDLVVGRFNLGREAMEKRRECKKKHLRWWHSMA